MDRMKRVVSLSGEFKRGCCFDSLLQLSTSTGIACEQAPTVSGGKRLEAISTFNFNF